MEVLILGNLKLFRMNTYAKQGGRATPQFLACGERPGEAMLEFVPAEASTP